MKQTPQEKKILSNFQAGKITKDGFLGHDTRHLHDIIEEDLRVLSTAGVTNEEIAARLQFFIDEGKKGIDNIVDIGDFIVTISWSRGMLPCPFGEPRLHHKIMATVMNKKLNIEIKYSQLNVHMIKEHGFFEGKGSTFRVEPIDIIRFLGLGE